MPREYSYSPIESHECRLLYLRPRKINGKLAGNLITYSFNDCPPYQTLSYCWGSANKPRSIEISGQTLGITQNLYDALRHLESWRTIVVWADAICINQDDLEEKTFQIRRMQDIYRGTPMTIWINYDKAPPFAKLEETFLKVVPEHELRVPYDHTRYKAELDISDDDLREVLDFFKVDWFSRVWVVQEVISAGKVTVKYGSHEMPWSRLANVAGGLSIFFETEALLAEVPKLFFLTVERERRYPLDKSGALPTSQGSRMMLFLYLAQLQSCSDLRDYWYGYHGLLQNEIDVPPDYSKDVVQVYCELTQRCIQLGSLEILERVEHADNRLPGLPSWAINPSQRTSPPLASLYFTTGGFHMSVPAKSLSLVRFDDRRMFLPMYTVDSVSNIVSNTVEWFAEYSENLTEQSSSTEFLQQLFAAERDQYKAMLGLSPDFAQSYITGEAMKTAFWRTHCCDMNAAASLPDSNFADDFEVFHRFTLSGDRLNMNEKESASYAAFNIGSSHRKDRHFIVTRAGFIGWASRASKVGHLVAVVPGARVPYTFEKTNDGLRLIGNAYVHGLMSNIVDGDSAELTDEGKRYVKGSLKILPIV